MHHIYYDNIRVHIFHYYSSNSSTSNHTVFTGVNNLSAVSGARTCVSRVMSTAECRCLFSRTDMQLRHVRVRCMRFLAYFLRFRCLNTTTLFNIDVKNMFSCRHCQLLCCHSAPFLWPIYLHETRVPGISVCIFSCNCTV